MGILLLSKIQTAPPRLIWFVPSAYVLFVLHLLKILLPQVRESDKEKRLSILKEAMPLCFLTHKQSEFSPSSLGISRTPIIILPAFFNFAFVLLFFFSLNVWNVYQKKENFETKVACASCCTGGTPGFQVLFGWILLLRRACLVVDLAQILFPSKKKKLLMKKDDGTSYAYGSSVSHSIGRMSIISDSWMVLV